MKKSSKKIVLIATCLVMIIASVLLVGCSDKTDTTYDWQKQWKMDTFNDLNKTAEHGQIVLLGDSIIELYHSDELLDVDRKVYNRGISGDTSDQMIKRLESNALSLEPTTLVILIGTNDNARKLSDESIIANIKACIETTQTKLPNCNLIIESIYPINSTMLDGRDNKNIRAINAGIKALCQEKNCTYLDLYAVLQDSEGDFDKECTYDGLHPNTNGYIRITKALEPLLK